MRVGYIVSRFPLVTETFILREFSAIDARPGISVSLFSLFAARQDTVHDAARPWLERLYRGRPLHALRALGWWSTRAPVRVLGVLWAVLRDYAADPRLLARALVTVALATDHARTVRREGVEHVHAHFGTYPALAAWVIRRLTDTPYSFTPHAHDLFVHQLGLRRKIREASFVVAISQFNRGYLTAVGATRAPVVRYGVDLTRYRFRVPDASHREVVAALCISSFKEYKGHAVLIEALDRGRPALDRLRVTLIGEGNLRPHIESLVQQRGLAGRVEFLGALPETQVAQRLAQADLLVQPSIVAANGDTEGIPNTLIEAMASGVPVVSTRVSGIPELVRDGDTGLLTEPGDAEALAAALQTLVSDPESARVRARAARALVEREYDIEGSAGRLCAEFLRREHSR